MLFMHYLIDVLHVLIDVIHVLFDVIHVLFDVIHVLLANIGLHNINFTVSKNLEWIIY